MVVMMLLLHVPTRVVVDDVKNRQNADVVMLVDDGRSRLNVDKTMYMVHTSMLAVHVLIVLAAVEGGRQLSTT
jgi:dihydroxyacetone kinase DhaKLM complex PTS-EIIA-like component DhaM